MGAGARGRGALTSMLSFGELFSLHGVLDQEQRPLGEHRAPPSVTRAVPTELRSCPYPGSRHEHRLPMNLSALRQATRHWDEVLVGLAALRTWCGGGPQPTTLAELWRLTAAVAVLPAYLLNGPRGGRVLDGATAALYKACLGLKFLIEQRVLQEILEGGALVDGGTADGLSDYAETSGWLVGRQEVCAAPPGLIREILDVAVRGRESEGGSRLVARVDSPEQLRAFAGASWDLYGLLLVYSTWSARLCLRSGGAGPDLDEDPPPQNGLSLTLGMRRITAAACTLDPAACDALLEAFCSMAAPAGEDRMLTAAREKLRDDLEVDRGEAFVAAQVRELEQRLNAALGRAAAPEGELPRSDLAAYRARPRSAA